MYFYFRLIELFSLFYFVIDVSKQILLNKLNRYFIKSFGTFVNISAFPKGTISKIPKISKNKVMK